MADRLNLAAQRSSEFRERQRDVGISLANSFFQFVRRSKYVADSDVTRDAFDGVGDAFGQLPVSIFDRS